MNIKAILFDLDDTLYDQQLPFREAMQSVFPHISCERLEDIYKHSRYYSDLLWEDHIKGRMSLKDLRIQRISRTMQDEGHPISEEQALIFQETYENRQASIQPWEAVPSLLRQLRDRGYLLGIITNGPVDHQRKKIEQLQLHTLVDESSVFISDALGVAKPDPLVFHEVSSRLGLPAVNLLYVGDTWMNDVVAPLQAGWQAVWFNHRKRTPQTAHRPLADIDHLPSLLALLPTIAS